LDIRTKDDSLSRNCTYQPLCFILILIDLVVNGSIAPPRVLFVLALLSKTVSATLPAALLVVFWWQRGRLAFKRDWSPLLPWLAAGAAYGLFTAWVDQEFIGAKGPGSSRSISLSKCYLPDV
jgi:hypothetical protein